MNNKQIEAIYDCLQEIIDTLCYQPNIPEKHKIDMLNKLAKLAETYYDTTLQTRNRD